MACGILLIVEHLFWSIHCGAYQAAGDNGVKALKACQEFTEGAGDKEEDLVTRVEFTGKGGVVAGVLLLLLHHKQMFPDDGASFTNILLHFLHVADHGPIW